jgi:hypothetical protein
MARRHFGLAAELAEAGFSTRAINALIYSLQLESLEALRRAPWEDLMLELSRTPNVGKKVIAEVEAFRSGRDPKSAVPIQTYVSVPFDAHALAALDAWISRQPEQLTRPEAVRCLVAKAIGL